MKATNAMLHTIVGEGLTNERYIADHTNNFAELKTRVAEFPPESTFDNGAKGELIIRTPAGELLRLRRIAHINCDQECIWPASEIGHVIGAAIW